MQYRFDGVGWLACVVKAVSNSAQSARYTITAEDEQQRMGVSLSAAEHGASKRWVFWQPRDLPGDPTCAILSVPNSETVKEGPPISGGDIDIYITERVAACNTEHAYYNWCPPYDWLRGRVKPKQPKKQKKGFVTVVFDPTPAHKKGFTAPFLLLPSKYGTRKRWVFTQPSEGAMAIS